MWIYIIIAIIVLIIIYAFALYNSFVKLNNKVKEAFSTMDVYLKKRWDLIPNIVETVKGYAKHEKDTLKEVVELRNSAYDKMSDEVKSYQKLKKILLIQENITMVLLEFIITKLKCSQVIFLLDCSVTNQKQCLRQVQTKEKM